MLKGKAVGVGLGVGAYDEGGVLLFGMRGEEWTASAGKDVKVSFEKDDCSRI